MAAPTTATSETICALDGQPIDRGSSVFIKAVDKLLTVGAYYSVDHAQYHVASEEVCDQIVAVIDRSGSLAIEITAKGMMIRSQLIDPQHRNVRLLHDLLVPLNVARLEFRNTLTPADLRRALEVLQEKRLQLGSTSGFQEIVIDGLPESVSTEGKNVVQGEHEGGLTLEELLAPFAATDSNPVQDENMTEGERLARHFLDIVSSILDNLQRSIADRDPDAVGNNPDPTPENIKALRESLRRLVEINPDPKDLARLIEDAKRALDLSRDPDSVDLVFSLLKKETSHGDRWREQGAKKAGKPEYRLTVDELVRQTEELAAVDDPATDPRVTSVTDHLGICFHLLEVEPSDSVEAAIVQALEGVLSRPRIPAEVLACCFSAMGTAAARDDVETIDRLYPAFCEPLRRSRSRELARFWTKLWKFLPENRHPVVWPHLVNDLMDGLAGVPRGVVAGLWRMAGSVSPQAALRAVPRLELLTAWTAGKVPTSLHNVPPRSVFPVYLAIMKSRLAPIGGPLLHHQLGRRMKSPLVVTLLQATGDYDSAWDGLYLSLAQQGDSTRLSDRTRRLAFRTLHGVLKGSDSAQREAEWVVDAIHWSARLDPDGAGPLMARIRDERKWLIFRTWPAAARRAAADVLARIERREAPGEVT